MQSKTAHPEAQSGQQTGRFAHAKKRVVKLLTRRKVVRYGLLSLHILLLGGIILFVLQTAPSSDGSHQNVVSSTGDRERTADPLDQVSTADIAVNLALMSNMAEMMTVAVANQADSASTQLAVPVQAMVVAKPQAVATELKSSKDIKNYTVQEGDTIASIASKFGVTSESIQWSNGLSGNAIGAGTKLWIPPVNGIVYTVKDGDNPDTLAQKFRASKDQIIAYNDAELDGLKVGQQIIIPNGQQPATRSAYGGYASGPFSPVYGSNGYIPGYCTWYVAKRRAEIGRSLPSNLGDAWTWDDRAIVGGIRVDNIPEVGAAVVTRTTTQPGHVAIVEEVNEDGSVWISEMNSSGQKSITDPTPAGGFNRVDFKPIPASTARTLNYIH